MSQMRSASQRVLTPEEDVKTDIIFTSVSVVSMLLEFNKLHYDPI